MTATLEKQPNCISALHIELPADRVGQERDKIVRDFMQHAQVPGYRAGKAPRMVIEAKYKQKIADELNQSLLSVGVREAIQQHKLRVLTVDSVEDVKHEANGPLSFTAKVVTAPEFELPAYDKLEIRAPELKVDEKEVEAALERLRARLADFEDVNGRPLAMDDFSVLDVAGQLDGKPVGESVEGNVGRELQGREGLWIKLGPGNFLPGFCEALVGMNAGDTREFPIALPADFPDPALAGKELAYTVTLKEIKRQVLPEVNDEFAAKVAPGKSLTELQELLRVDLENQKREFIEEGKRRQIIDHLNRSVEFDLPANLVRSEVRRIAADIVRQNQERGVSDEKIMENQKEIAGNATAAANERLKGAFILTRIAEKENIRVSKDEMNERITAMAVRYGTSVDKMKKDLVDRDALTGIEEEVLIAKTLAYLTSNATVLPLPENPPAGA
jgi:trigger factor